MIKANKHQGIWHKIKIIWVSLGSIFLIVFLAWNFLAYQATETAYDALQSDANIQITESDNYWQFMPTSNHKPIGLMFYAGAMVAPAAYAPLIREIAQLGYPALLIKLPNRGAFGAANKRGVIVIAEQAMKSLPSIKHWAVSGHSKGGAIAARFAQASKQPIAGLILIGTTHPRDFSLAELTIPVTKIIGTHDGIAPLVKSERNRPLLPSHTNWVAIEGANHSQFGYYGFQFWDNFSDIDRQEQQRITLATIIQTLKRITITE